MSPRLSAVARWCYTFLRWITLAEGEEGRMRAGMQKQEEEESVPSSPRATKHTLSCTHVSLLQIGSGHSSMIIIKQFVMCGLERARKRRSHVHSQCPGDRWAGAIPPDGRASPQLVRGLRPIRPAWELPEGLCIF